jgi:hypothetical protein
MYENKISTATLGGHGLGGKVALAAACYHFDKVTGYFGIDTSPMNQFYHQTSQELRTYLHAANNLNTARSYSSISAELKNSILCPKWRSIFLSNLVKADNGYEWNFNLPAVFQNLIYENPSNLSCWHSGVGLYPGRATFLLPEHSRHVHLSTNTLPMYKVLTQLQGLNQDIFSIQGDDNPQSTVSLTQVTGSTNARRTATPSPTDSQSSSNTTTESMCCSRTVIRSETTTSPTSTARALSRTTSQVTASPRTTTTTGASTTFTRSDQPRICYLFSQSSYMNLLPIKFIQLRLYPIRACISRTYCLFIVIHYYPKAVETHDFIYGWLYHSIMPYHVFLDSRLFHIIAFLI